MQLPVAIASITSNVTKPEALQTLFAVEYRHRDTDPDGRRDMHLRAHKTKITATIGPASSSPAVIGEMIRAGMDIARLNFSHGEFEDHRRSIESLRAAAQAAGRDVAILADLPGPKIRLGAIEGNAVRLVAGQAFILATEEVTGGQASPSSPPRRCWNR